VDAFRDDQDVGLRTVDWGSSCAPLPGLTGDMGHVGRLGVLAAEPARLSAIGYGPMLPRRKLPLKRSLLAGRALVDADEE
jgi:hypothetical protein